MKLITEITIYIKRGFLPHLTNEIYKRGFKLQRLTQIESNEETDTFVIDILYNNSDKFKGLIDKIVKHDNNFKIKSIKNPVEEKLLGGFLNVSGKMPLGNIFDYETNINGAFNLILEKIDEEVDTFKYTGISKNIGIFSGTKPDVESEKDISKMYVQDERDSVIINNFSGLNAFPFIIKFSQIEEFIKILHGIESTFVAFRISNIEEISDISLYNLLYSDLSKPILSKFYDEIPLFLLIAIKHIIHKHKIDLNESNIGIIGIDISSLRITRLLVKLGCSRILGCDNNEQLMLRFEKEGGLATTQENIFKNSDIIIFIKDHYEDDDIYKIGPGLIIISLIDKLIDENIIKECSVREYISGEYMNLSLLFPGILKGLVKSNIIFLDDEKIISLSNRIFGLSSEEEILPDLFSDIHERVSEFVLELS